MEDEITTAQAAEIIGVSRSQIQHLCQKGKIPFRVVGAELGPRRATYLIRRADAEAYKESARKSGWPKGVLRKQQGDGPQSEPPPVSEREGYGN